MIRGRLALAGLLLGSASLSGCMSLSGNVKGDFACRAPDGICAPSGNIDDRALAMISGEEGDHMIAPAGPYVEPPSEGRGYQKASSPVRTRERVLRIVFPAQIDASGRLRHLLTLEGLPRETLLQLLDRAGQIRDAAVGRVGNKRHVLAGSAVCTLFFEPSTRTRSSFQLAAQRLASLCIALMLVVLGGMTVIGEVALSWLAATEGLSQDGELAVQLTMVMLPYI